MLLQQEQGANATEIWNGIKYVRPGHGFEPNFQLFAKIEANGENEVPLYTYLKVSMNWDSWVVLCFSQLP